MSRVPATTTIDTLSAQLGSVQVLPTSFAQQRFWLLDQMVEDRSAYTIPVALRLKGALNTTALTAALNAVVARHESLRTVFALDGDMPSQVVLPALVIDVPMVSLRSEPPAAREARVLSLTSDNANTAFDVSKGPLVRASLLELEHDEHVLLLALHHLVADGVSVGVLFEELAEGYEALMAGGRLELPPLSLQYPDFAVWQRKIMTGAGASRQLAFWREQLAGLEPLELPTDFPRPVTLSVRGGKREIEIATATVEGMRALARRELVTPSAVFLAAFFALLHRYSGQSDFAVASITSGRLRPEVEPLIGLFVNTLAVRAAFRDGDSFSELLRTVAQSSVQAQANQNVPFEHVVDALQVPHDESRPPVVQVCFQLLEGLGREPRLADLAVSRVPSVKQTSKFELTLMLHPTAGGAVRAVMEYASDLFEAATIDRMLEHYATLMVGIVRDVQTPVAQLPLLGAAERTEVLERWNNAAQPLPQWTVPSRVVAQVAATPNIVAVQAGIRSLTYSELAQQSTALASELVKRGVRAGNRVAVCVDRTPDLLVALLAVLRVGAAYVPIDASYPSERISYVLGDADATAVVADAESLSALPWTNLPVVRVDELSSTVAPEPFVDAVVDANALAYVLYTSGSTGLPKGVMVSHGALANFLHSMSVRPGLRSGDAIVAVTTLAFDIAGLELWLPLVVGARVELASREVAVDGVQLSTLVSQVAASVAPERCLLQATPATWRLLVESGWSGTPNLTMLCGGEGWPPGLAESLLNRGQELWNVYGPTETTIWSTHARITEGGQPSLGEPLANTSLYVIERGGQPAPVGVPGELFIGGAGLAHGYHNRPELTAERFVERPPLGRLYRTGDHVVRRASGRLDYLGRLDDQVKLRGHRIELGEIEAVLSAQPEVSQAIVAVRSLGTPPEPQLIAYLVLAIGQPGNVSGVLAARLRAALPAYMVPALFVTLDAIPLTSNGKANRRALPTPDIQVLQVSAYVAPRTPLEEMIVSQLQEILGREKIGVSDDFFAMGGHSLAAMRLAARLSDACAANVPIRAVFESRTAEAMALWLEAHGISLDDDLATMMAELDTMTDEEARELLASNPSKVS